MYTARKMWYIPKIMSTTVGFIDVSWSSEEIIRLQVRTGNARGYPVDKPELGPRVDEQADREERSTDHRTIQPRFGNSNTTIRFTHGVVLSILPEAAVKCGRESNVNHQYPSETYETKPRVVPMMSAR